MSSGLERTPAKRTWVSAWSRAMSKITGRIINWRHWRLPVKITAVVLVPVIFTLVLGVLQISGQTRQANEYANIGRVVTAGSAVRLAIDRLQRERSQAAEFLVRGPIAAPEVQERFTASDRALEDIQRLLRAAPDSESVRFARQETDRQLTELAPLRKQVLGTHTDPGVAINSYTELIGVLLALDRTLISQISSSQLVSTATTAHELAQISEEVQLQQALVLVGLTRGSFTTDNLARLASSESRRTAAVQEFRAAATPQQRLRYDQLYAKPEVPARETSVQLAMAERDSGTSRISPLLVSSATWKDQSRISLEALNALQARLDSDLHNTAFTLQDTASNMAGLESVILLSALLIAGAIVVVVARQLLGSLDVLRRSALDTANYQLPQAVANIRAGHNTLAPVQPVPVNTIDEIGEVARAFDDVHAQAVNLATEQAELRRSYSDSFVNVSRRSQSLLERQLRLFDQLERDEEDPDQLATLFQLDHLATRMRRNNENLMVLSGTDPARRFTQPTSPGDLIRAAVSEIEHYPRVIVQPLPNAKIVGYAASDLVRLLAELLDNAANFSAPDTQVAVSGQLRSDGSLGLDIVDRGIGMTDAELAAVNQRLTSDEEIKLSTSRRMGLFVVGQLATRHGIRVELRPGPDEVGVHVAVSVAPELMLDAAGPAPDDMVPDDRDEDTLVEEFDWEAAEQDAASQHHLVNNGSHLLQPPAEGAQPQQPPSDLSDTDEIIPAFSDPAHHNDAPATTPIFDDLASAWFQAAPPAPWLQARPTPTTHSPNPPADVASKGTFLSPMTGRFPSTQPTPNGHSQKTWIFANDQAWRRAEEVAGAEPADYTSAGLPLRVPQANLVAGSAEVEKAERSRLPRDPQLVRGRLASFQAGVRRGRHRQQAALGSSTAPTGVSQVDWNSRANSHAEAPGTTSVDYTSAGLPRRSPRAQLVPGPATESVAKPPRDADLMRGRLASFQRGVREGKHSLRAPQHSADERR
ncbi:nitrate- and nitrite sensing domain-containing protein [Saccharopolyspora sp. K220]|uniref:nitrate- and nitrite sensing domain-containing protein n=1 Tax=Saccharopolyspora soli TaxID=2926618 RepID=UPI001F55F984|nr:nitrate- and nitrite sensing domain-containing protein [Saccharopolyspora soli]MCI2416654.1 nitrate- and nitrite sensing domain-containing protein [Saccharopolyspora soli]